MYLTNYTRYLKAQNVQGNVISRGNSNHHLAISMIALSIVSKTSRVSRQRITLR